MWTVRITRTVLQKTPYQPTQNRYTNYVWCVVCCECNYITGHIHVYSEILNSHTHVITHTQYNSILNTRHITTYRVIEKSLCTLWLQHRKLQVIFKVSPSSLHTFIDTSNCALEDRVQHSTVHIPNVFCDVHIEIINCVGIVCTVIARCTDTFRSPSTIRPSAAADCNISHSKQFYTIISTFLPCILLLSKFFVTNWCTRELFSKEYWNLHKITIAATCFGVITIIRERTVWACYS